METNIEGHRAGIGEIISQQGLEVRSKVEVRETLLQRNVSY